MTDLSGPPSLPEPPDIGKLLASAGVGPPSPGAVLGVPLRCRCCSAKPPEVKTLRLFRDGGDFAARCWNCGFAGHSVSLLRHLTRARGYRDIAGLADGRIFPGGVPDAVIAGLEARDRVLSRFHRWRARLRFESAHHCAVALLPGRHDHTFVERVGFGDHGLATPGEVAKALPEPRLPTYMRRETLLHTELLRNLFGVPVCLVVSLPVALRGHGDMPKGLPVWIGPKPSGGALLAAPLSIDYVDITGGMLLTFNPAIAAELFKRMADRRPGQDLEPPTVDPDRMPAEKGLPLALLYKPTGRVGQVPFGGAAIVHRKGEVPPASLAFGAGHGIRLVGYEKGAPFSGDPAELIDSGRGRPPAQALAGDIAEGAAADGRCPFGLLREVSADHGVGAEGTAKVANILAASPGIEAALVTASRHGDTARFYEVGDTRYRLSSYVYYRATRGHDPRPATNFSLEVLTDILDPDGGLAGHLIRLTLAGFTADFELAARDFDDPRRLWAAVCSAAVREGFPAYPEIASTTDKSRLPMVARGTQAAAPQVREGAVPGFADGIEFNAPDFTVTAHRAIRRRNIPPGQLRVVGAGPGPAPDLGAMAREFGGWMGSGNETIWFRPALAAACVWWLHRASSGGRAYLAVSSPAEMRLLEAMLGLAAVGRGRAERHKPGFPKLLAGKVRTLGQMAAHGDVVAGVAVAHNRLDPAVAVTVADSGGNLSPPQTGGWLALFAHACLGAATPEVALARLADLCAPSGSASLKNTLEGGLRFLARPHSYLDCFLDACAEVGVGDLVMECRGRRYLPVRSVELVNRAGYRFNGLRLLSEFRSRTGMPQPYFLGRRKEHTWQLADDMLGAEKETTRARPTTGVQIAPLRDGRHTAAYRLGSAHAYFEWTHPKAIADEFRVRPALRKRYAGWLSAPGINPAKQLTDPEKKAYAAGYSVSALNCISRTMPIDYVAPFDWETIAGGMGFDFDRRLAALLAGDHKVSADNHDQHFERFLQTRHLLEPGPRPATPVGRVSNPFGGIKITTY